MKTTKQLIAEYKAENPVVRNFHSGLWGYDRVHDCVDLSRCTFKSKRAAEVARSEDAARWAAAMLSAPSPAQLAEEKEVKEFEAHEAAKEAAINAKYRNA